MNSNSRLAYLDSLRGIAALAVAVWHFLERTPFFIYVQKISISPGQFGVAMFFVISGMVIPYSLKDGPRAVTRFAISRFFRLYPAYWVSLFLAVLVHMLFLQQPFDPKRLLVNATMFQGLFRVPDMFGIYWTLLLEMAFYIATAVLFITGLRRWRHMNFICALSMLGFVILLWVMRYNTGMFFIPTSYLLSLGLMFFGSIWRDVSLNGWKSKNLIPSLIWLSAFLATLVLIAILAGKAGTDPTGEQLAYFGGATLGVLFMMVFTTVIKLEARWLVFLGTISYSVYLFHPFFLEWATYATAISQNFSPGVFALYMMATLGLAMLSYRLIEVPSINFARALQARLSQPDMDAGGHGQDVCRSAVVHKEEIHRPLDAAPGARRSGQ